jgi:glutamine synthetase
MSMSKYTKQDIIHIVEEEDVEFIRLQFTDIFGNLKNMAVTASQLNKVLENQCMFDGSSIEGFVRIEESDMYLHPDLDTFVIFPWRPQQGKVARIICDVYCADGTPFAGDSRQMLGRQLKKAQDMGYTFEVGPECEFFLFNLDDAGNPTTTTNEKAGYFDLGPVDLGENARRDIVLTLEDMGFEIEASHHEYAPAQHEIDLKYGEAMTTADNLMTFKLAVKTIAKHHGFFASFMPKPVSHASGSGMHVNMSLRKDGRNIFSDADDELGLSKEAYYFIGGIMKHIKGMTLILNPLVNSYKRLMGEDEAPRYIAWSAMNRSPLIRIPCSGGENKRVELRSPDPSTNPYLAFAVCLAAGLDGIENKILPPACVKENLYALTEEERREKGVEQLPNNIHQAIREFEKDALIQEVIGEHIASRYIKAKTKEWESYCSEVTDWEVNEYLYKI